MSSFESSVFELKFEVSEADIDELNHVSNIVYLRWVQDVAVAHWQAVASLESKRSIVWVVLRHEIDYRSPAVLGDSLLARTWVGEATGITFERHTEIIRDGDKRVLVQARTIWCPINTETGRPTRVSREIREQFSAQTSERKTDEQGPGSRQPFSVCNR
jgi:acyl-CoA thioester hydrolase